MLVNVGVFPRKIENLHFGIRNKQKIHTKWSFQSPERLLSCKLHLCSWREMDLGVHTLGVLCRDWQHLILCLLSGIENVPSQGFSCVILIHPNHQWIFSILSLSEHNFLIQYYLASTKDVFHCPVSWNNALYHMISTFNPFHWQL